MKVQSAGTVEQRLLRLEHAMNFAEVVLPTALAAPDDLAVGGTGTVTSVGLAAPPEFTVSGSPVTVAGTLTFTKNTQAANLVYAGPISGGAVVPTFRALDPFDIPNLSASKITSGLLALARGGTNADLSGTGGASQVLRQSGAGAAITVSQLAFTDLSGTIADAQVVPRYRTTFLLMGA